MRGPRSTRRLDEELLDRTLSGSASGRGDLEALALVARMLGHTLEVAPDPRAVELGRLAALGAFRAAGRNRPRRWRSTVPRLLLRASVTLAALVVAFALLMAALWPVTARALPGDLLYRAKLGFEGARLTLASGPLAEGQVYLDIAESRIEELVRAEAVGRRDILASVLGRYVDVVAAFEERLAEARSANLDVEPLSARAEREFAVHQTILIGLLDLVPEAARAGIEQAIEASGGGVPPPGESPPIPPIGPLPIPTDAPSSISTDEDQEAESSDTPGIADVDRPPPSPSPPIEGSNHPSGPPDQLKRFEDQRPGPPGARNR